MQWPVCASRGTTTLNARPASEPHRRWNEADVAQQLGMKIEAWNEQTADQVKALVAQRIEGRPDVR